MLKKKVPVWITYPVLVIFAVSLVFTGVFFYMTQTLSAQTSFLIPFGGKLTDVDFLTCSCGFIILTVQDKRTQAPVRVIYFYLAQVIEELTDLLPDRLLIPRLYLFYALYPGVETLGNYVPVAGAPCLTIVPYPPYCQVVEPGAAGYLFQMGTSLTPAR